MKMMQQVNTRNKTQTLFMFEGYLREEERSSNTIAKYKHDIQAFFRYLDKRKLTKAEVLAWKEALVKMYAPASVNSMLAAVNKFLVWMEKPEYKVKPLKIQRTLFAKPEKELTEEEYHKLVSAAEEKKNQQLALLIQTICALGIRVSELRFITVEALHTGRAAVECKGKTRTVFIPKTLCQMLLRFCKQRGKKRGSVFCTKSGKPLDRSNIWRMMKLLCKTACVDPGKVFPHNLRHLFARTYYKLEKDLCKLADLLGHSNISTTRIYTMESGTEHIKQLERMHLIHRRA